MAVSHQHLTHASITTAVGRATSSPRRKFPQNASPDSPQNRAPSQPATPFRPSDEIHRRTRLRAAAPLQWPPLCCNRLEITSRICITRRWRRRRRLACCTRNSHCEAPTPPPPFSPAGSTTVLQASWWHRRCRASHRAAFAEPERSPSNSHQPAAKRQQPACLAGGGLGRQPPRAANSPSPRFNREYCRFCAVWLSARQRRLPSCRLGPIVRRQPNVASSSATTSPRRPSSTQAKTSPRAAKLKSPESVDLAGKVERSGVDISKTQHFIPAPKAPMAPPPTHH